MPDLQTSDDFVLTGYRCERCDHWNNLKTRGRKKGGGK